MYQTHALTLFEAPLYKSHLIEIHSSPGHGCNFHSSPLHKGLLSQRGKLLFQFSYLHSSLLSRRNHLHKFYAPNSASSSRHPNSLLHSFHTNFTRCVHSALNIQESLYRAPEGVLKKLISKKNILYWFFFITMQPVWSYSLTNWCFQIFHGLGFF